jgi:hypothetical protein
MVPDEDYLSQGLSGAAVLFGLQVFFFEIGAEASL